jgi:hypothetical protein
MVVPPSQDDTTIASPTTRGQFSLSSSPFYDGGLVNSLPLCPKRWMLISCVLFDVMQGDDFDIYFFLFFILPILVPVVGLGVVALGT